MGFGALPGLRAIGSGCSSSSGTSETGRLIRDVKAGPIRPAVRVGGGAVASDEPSSRVGSDSEGFDLVASTWSEAKFSDRLVAGGGCAEERGLVMSRNDAGTADDPAEPRQRADRLGTTETARAEAALLRGARGRLDRIEEIRDAHAMAANGMDQIKIAEVLMTTQSRVRMMLRAGDFSQTGPEEVILRAAVDGSDRDALVRRLSRMEYTFRVYAPDPADGAIPGSWDQVKQAYLTGLLSKDEYLAVAGAFASQPEER